MQSNDKQLGKIVKSKRIAKNIKTEELATTLGISERYLYMIENKCKKPSFDLLTKIIHELAICADEIFYPEKSTKNPEIENLIHMLYSCDENSLKIIKATIKATIDMQKV